MIAPHENGAPAGEDTIDADALESSLLTFAEDVLGFDLYGWQCNAISPFDGLSRKLVMVSLATPNGSGKSAVVIPTIVLGMLHLYPQAKVVLTTADGKQLDGQVMPALEAHREKFPTWNFIERYIGTPTGGFFVCFTTDQAGRAEGWHKINDTAGPLVMICDEAKTIPEAIFTAVDRCTYNAILLTSSPGLMLGRFYQSQSMPSLGYVRVKAGLADCPHIAKDKIDRLMAQYGPDGATPDPEYLKSTLHGEFMTRVGEVRFDREGLANLAAMGESRSGTYGRLEQSRATGSVIFFPDEEGWLWVDEVPERGRSYLMSIDPNSCEQAEGTTERDNTACAILRDGYVTAEGSARDGCVAAVLHWPGGVKWDSDVVARRAKLLADWYGGVMCVCEANNFGSALMKELAALGVSLWRRTKPDAVNPNKEVKLNGYLTTERTRAHWVEACATMVREKSLVCRYRPACEEFQTFVTLPSGRSEAVGGKHDDWVSCIGIGLVVKCYGVLTGAPRVEARHGGGDWNYSFAPAGPVHSYGSGAVG